MKIFIGGIYNKTPAEAAKRSAAIRGLRLIGCLLCLTATVAVEKFLKSQYNFTIQ